MKKVLQWIGVIIMCFFVLAIGKMIANFFVHEATPAIVQEVQKLTGPETTEEKARASMVRLINARLPMKVDEVTRMERISYRESGRKLFYHYVVHMDIADIDFEVGIPTLKNTIKEKMCLASVREKFKIWDSVEHEYMDTGGNLLFAFVTTDGMCN